MSDDKRKLKIVAVGAGDPTLKLTLNIPPIEGEVSGVSTLSFGLLVNVWNDQVFPALDTVVESIPVGEDITILSSFPAPDHLPNTINLNASIQFNSSEYDFEIENATSPILPAVPSSNGIDFNNIPILGPQDTPLSNQAILHCQCLDGNGNLVFLRRADTEVMTGSILEAEEILYSSDNRFHWRIDAINLDNSLFTLFNLSNQLYLYKTANGLLGWSNTAPDTNNGYWFFQQADGNWNKYHITNNEAGEYLSANTNTGQISLETGTPCNWYVHLKS